MKNNKTALKILFASLFTAAVFSSLWGFMTGSSAVPGLIAAILLLLAAQLLLFVMVSDRQAENHSPENFAPLNTRLEALEEHVKRLAQLREIPLQEIPEEQPGLAAIPDAAQPHTGPAYLDDQRLSLYLEPVVDISTMKTAFYRAELAFETDRSDRIRISDISAQIITGGHSADIDMKLFNQLGPVIDRLAQKGQPERQLAGVICPVSKHSFSNQLFLENLTRHLKQYPELARVLVIEISQENLADLSPDGRAGLAFLAQIGATFCLGGAGLESPDLDSLASLGFRYLDLDYNDNIKRYGLQAFTANELAAKLRDSAQKVDIALIGSGFIRKNQCDALNHVIKFGRGTIFSAPRLVRSDFANKDARSKAA